MKSKIEEIQDRITLRHVLIADYKSAYNNNGRNVELALSLVSNLRGIDKETVRSILHPYFKRKIEKK
jgi:hypothetical protein